MHSKHRIDMTEGPILRKMLLFVYPLIITNVLQHLYSAADNAVVGQFVGASALAAVGATGPATSLILNLLIGVSAGANIVNSNLLGAKKFKELRKSMHTSIAIGFTGGLAVSVLGILVGKWLLQLMSCPDNILNDATLYLRIIFCGTPATMVYNYGSGILRTHGDSQRPMYIMAVSGLVNVGLNLVFVLVLHMSVAGVALATIISKYIAAAWVITILFNPKGDYKLRFAEVKLYPKQSLNIIKIGLPCGLNPLVFSISNATVQSAVNGFGDIVVAGSVASANITGMIYQVLAAFYSCCINFSGQCSGAGKYKRIDKVALLSSGICVAFVSVCSTVLTLFPGTFISLFNTDPQVIATGTEKLIIMAWSYVLYGISEAVMGCLRGLRKTTVPSVINIFCVCAVRVLWVWLVCPFAPESQRLLFMCYPVSYLLSASTLVIYFIHVRRQLDRKQLLKQQNASKISTQN